ncbi:MAG: ABC transporter ATP-binding protein [Bacteroidetes bacterium]|nr:ABC transporter ATP-binding protein [Bacteroidota bacterium]
MNEILEIKNLKTYFHTDDGTAKAVDDVSLKLFKGETLGIVGESGCGKSVTVLSILRLLPEGTGVIEGGKIIFDGRDITAMSSKEIRKIRGNRIGMIFQEPMTSLNPAYTCGSQIKEVIETHTGIKGKEADEKTFDIMRKAGIPMPEQRMKEYPHQLSGGLRQRVMIAMALACSPDVLIADEPTTALDVTVQAQILELIKELQEESGMSVILITHDLGVVAETCERVIVMYASKIVEEGLTKEIFGNPKHPYTKRLLESIPSLKTEREKLPTIEGTVPSSLNYPEGCRFRTRCLIAGEECLKEPVRTKISETHFASCFKIN